MMTNREKYAKTPLEEVFKTYMRDRGAYETLVDWLGKPAKADDPGPSGASEEPKRQADDPGPSGASEEPKRQADPLPGALGALTGLLAAGLAGKNGESPHVNVWVLVNGRPA